jgi:hypothetical protein
MLEDVVGRKLAEQVFFPTDFGQFRTVQECATTVFPKFLEAVTTAGHSLTSIYLDTHALPLSNLRKPDNSHVAPGHGATPIHMRCIGDLKKRRSGSVFSTEEKEAAFSYALQWLEEQPFRKKFVVYLTDICIIQFFSVFKGPRPDMASYYFYESPTLALEGVGQAWLAGLLCSNDETIGYPPDMRLVIFRQKAALFDRFLGQGVTAMVFADTDRCVVKLFRNHIDAHAELSIIQELHRRVVKLDAGTTRRLASGISLLPPLGQVILSDDGLALRFPWVGTPLVFESKGFMDIVTFLELLHACHFAHRDVRPSNFVMYLSKVIPIDYGSLYDLGIAGPYHGTDRYASDTVIQQLQATPTHAMVTAKDDLMSLVRSIRCLLSFEPALFEVDLTTAFEKKTLSGFWASRLAGWWTPLVAHALSGDYAALRTDLERWISYF